MMYHTATDMLRTCFVNIIGLASLMIMGGCETRPLAERSCTITGRIITADGGMPIAGARVLVVVPEVDQSASPRHFGLTYVGVTGADGRYAIAGLPARTGDSVELIAKARGYRTPWSAGNESEPMPKATLRAGIVEAAELGLKKGDSFFCSGIIVDETGSPIQGVDVSSNRLIASSDPSGAFEIIGEASGRDSLTTVVFTHPDYIDTWIDDISRTPPAERERMRIVLKSGVKIGGLLLDPGGRPMAATLVQITTLGSQAHPYKGAMADDAGRFSIKGIAPGAYRLCATTPTASGGVLVDLTRNAENVTLRLAAEYTGRPRTVRFLGMTLAEADDAMAAHWGVRKGSVIILDPGTEVGGRAPYVLKAWSRIDQVQTVGSDAYRDVGNLSDLLSAMVDQVARRPRGAERVDVGIGTTFPSPRGDVSLFLPVKLSASAGEEARKLLATMPVHQSRKTPE